MKKKIIIILCIIIAAIQFVQPVRNQNGQLLPADITRVYPVPDSTHQLLQRSCYDCHSNNTQYPWYAYVQPFGWYLQRHINQGKEELNFSEFGNYTIKRQKSKLRSIAGSVEDGTMPLPSYLWIHNNAALTKDEKQQLIQWATRLRDSLNKN